MVVVVVVVVVLVVLVEKTVLDFTSFLSISASTSVGVESAKSFLPLPTLTKWQGSIFPKGLKFWYACVYDDTLIGHPCTTLQLPENKATPKLNGKTIMSVCPSDGNKLSVVALFYQCLQIPNAFTNDLIMIYQCFTNAIRCFFP